MHRKNFRFKLINQFKSIPSFFLDLFAIDRIKGLLYICSFLAIGEIFQYLFALPISGNILRMILLFLTLKQQWIKLAVIKPASDKLLEYLVLFFIPYGVGLMTYGDLFQTYWLPITLAVAGSTVLTLLITGGIVQKFKR